MATVRRLITSHVAQEATSYATRRLPLATQLLTSPVDVALMTRHRSAHEHADQLRRDFPDSSTAGLASRAAHRTTLRAAVSGAATGGLATVPAVGTAAAAVAVTADLSVTLASATELVMTIGALYGYRGQSLEERRTWAFAVLSMAFDSGGEPDRRGPADAVARPGGAAIVSELGEETRVGVNRAIVERVVLRLGLRAGILRIGRLLPMGVGAAVGGVGNTTFMRAVARNAVLFFEPPPGGPTQRRRRDAAPPVVVEGSVRPGSRRTIR